MMVQPSPGAAVEVSRAQFFLQLLLALFDGPVLVR